MSTRGSKHWRIRTGLPFPRAHIQTTEIQFISLWRCKVYFTDWKENISLVSDHLQLIPNEIILCQVRTERTLCMNQGLSQVTVEPHENALALSVHSVCLLHDDSLILTTHLPLFL